jgi:hypothetical protein
MIRTLYQTTLNFSLTLGEGVDGPNDGGASMITSALLRRCVMMKAPSRISQPRR